MYPEDRLLCYYPCPHPKALDLIHQMVRRPTSVGDNLMEHVVDVLHFPSENMAGHVNGLFALADSG
jgi:hypothetical protein